MRTDDSDIFIYLEFLPIGIAVFTETFRLVSYNQTLADELKKESFPTDYEELSKFLQTLWESPDVVTAEISFSHEGKYKLLILPTIKNSFNSKSDIETYLGKYFGYLKATPKEYDKKFNIREILNERSKAKTISPEIASIEKEGKVGVLLLCGEPFLTDFLEVVLRRLDYVPIIVSSREEIREIKKISHLAKIMIGCEEFGEEMKQYSLPMIIITEFGRKSEAKKRFPDTIIIEKPPKFDEITKALNELKAKYT